MIHEQKHPLAGYEVRLKTGKFFVEDWADRVYGRSIWAANGNPAALFYAIRRATQDLPFDNEILYGKIDGLGFLVHVSEIEQEAIVQTYDVAKGRFID